MIFCDSSVMSPESPTEDPVRCAVALAEFDTWRDEIVTFCATVILSSACRIRLPAFQVIELPLSDELVPPFVTPVLRSISALISNAAGSINTVPCCPFCADADKDPPDKATTLRAENSTNPPSPDMPPSADKREPAARSLLFSAITRISPPELLWPWPSAEITAPAPTEIFSPARMAITPASFWSAPSAWTRPDRLMSVTADRLILGATACISITLPVAPAGTVFIFTTEPIFTRACSPAVSCPVISSCPEATLIWSTAFTWPRISITPVLESGAPLSRTVCNCGAEITFPAPNIEFMKS